MVEHFLGLVGQCSDLLIGTAPKSQYSGVSVHPALFAIIYTN